MEPADVFTGVQLRRDRHFEIITLTQESYIEAHSDIQYAVSFLCTFSASPGVTHYAALLNVLGYLQALDQKTFFSLLDYTLNLDGGPGSRVVLTGQTARLWKKTLVHR